MMTVGKKLLYMTENNATEEKKKCKPAN